MIVKICGITSVEDAREVLSAGADWIGLNVFTGPRSIGLPRAFEITLQLQKPDAVVMLLSTTHDQLNNKSLASLRKKGIFRLQIYGDVSAPLSRLLADLEFKWIRPMQVNSPVNTYDFHHWEPNCHPEFFLIDAWEPGKQGGTGRRVDEDLAIGLNRRLKSAGLSAMMLAGGLDPDNVGQAVRSVGPAGVDVATGVESAPGVKDMDKVCRFIAEARRAAIDSSEG